MDNFFVADQYRTSRYSLIPGGYDVKIYFANGTSRIYDKIKYPETYIEKAKKNDPTITKCEILGPSKV